MADRINFWDIVNNPDYYEKTDDGKDFFVCATERFIPKSKIDTEQTKYLDMHCKCGDPVVIASFTLEELEIMENDRIESRKYENMVRSVDRALCGL